MLKVQHGNGVLAVPEPAGAGHEALVPPPWWEGGKQSPWLGCEGSLVML